LKTPSGRDSSWSIEVIDASFVVGASVLSALLVAVTGYWLVPLRDPVDVVGCPLFQGYSESSEQLFFYLFIVAAVVAAGVTTRWLRPASIRTGFSHGTPLILLLLIAAAATIWLPYAVVSSFVPLLAAWLLGSSRAVGRQPSMGLILAFWLLPFSFVVVRNMRHIVVEVGRDPVALAAVLATLATLGLALRRQIRHAPSRARWLLAAFDRFADRRPGVALAIWLVAAMACIYPYLRWTFLAVAVAAALGVVARVRHGSSFAWWSPEWIGLVVMATALSCSQAIPFLPSWNHLAVWLLAVVVGIFVGTRFLTDANVPPLSLPRAGWLRWALLGLLLVPFLRYATANLWTGALLSLIVCALLLRRPRSRSFLVGVSLGIAILVAVLPRVELDRPFDPPHDGQVLSAVWELENDRTLYEEVFPLRGYQFFLCLLSRQLLPPTVQGLHVVQQLVTFLHLGGVCALVFAWTRSGAWSFAAAMLLLWSGYHSNFTMDLASRQGLMLWIAALMIAYLRSYRPGRWLYLVIAAVCAAASGFDSYAALLPALAAAALVSWYLSGSRTCKRLVVELIPVALAVAAPMVLLGLWQGPQSVRWFWTLLIESSQYYNAFFGMPIELSTQEAPLVFTGLLAVGVWATVGVHFWDRMRRRKRMMWIFLLVFFIFVLHRGVGRSYWMWLQCVIQPALIMAAIGAYELISLLRRRGHRDLTTDRSVIAVAASAVLLWTAPVSLGSPQELVEAVWSMPRQQQQPLRVAAKPRDVLIDLDSYVTEQVAPDQTLWAIESGFLNFLYERHNPTRHTLAVTSWPIENARMVEAMRQQPPVLIHFDHRTFEFQHLHDMPFTVRYYIVSQLVFAEYQPSANPPYLTRVTPDWQGFDETPTWLEWPFELQKLPRTWGELRAPRLNTGSRRQLRHQPVDTQTMPTSRTFEVDCSPRDFNYLHLRMAVRAAPWHRRGGSSVRLEVASPGGAFDTTSAVAFEVRADGSASDYLVPIGCSPSWSWRRHIDRLRVSCDQEAEIISSEVELWFVDEMERFRR
jgi:hypothetical protein